MTIIEIWIIVSKMQTNVEEKKRGPTVNYESSSSTEEQSFSYTAGGEAEHSPMEGHWSVTGKTALPSDPEIQLPGSVLNKYV